MNTSVQARRPAARLILRLLLMVALLPVSGLLTSLPAHAAYINRFSTITNGAITFTGNTLGLSKQPTTNAPGTSDAIGAFITTNTALRDGTLYPFGTTADWHQNSSAAVLNLPPGSTVLHAELIWSGSYSYGGENILSAIDTPVSLTTPGGATFPISPDSATSNILGTPDGAGGCTSDPVPSPPATVPCFYVRSADVTLQVQAAGAYTVGGVPGTQGTPDQFHNNAGWTLAAVYHNPSLPARSLTLFVGEEVTNTETTTNRVNQVTIGGFCTPPNGQLSGRLLVSATEGDANRVGDQMQFGPTSTTLNPVFGPNNPINNFFASQINNDTGALDMTGTFGTRNQNAAGTANVSGGRQGWDITNVDASARLINGQNSAVVWGTSNGDQYVINALGTQIDIQAPAFRPDTKTVDKPVTVLGDTLTYNVVVENIGTANADNVVFFDPAPAGTSFIANSFTINGAPQAGADPNVGISLGTVAPGLANAKTVTFQVRVNSIPPSFQFDNRARWTYDYQLCSGTTRLAGEVTTNQVTTRIAALQSSKSVTPIGPVAAGQVLTYEIRSTNAGSANTAGTTLQDSIPAGTTYIANSTTLNGAAVSDVAGAMPFTTARTINSPASSPGVIAAGASAIVRFRVRVNAGVTTQISNVATIDEDGPNGLIPPSTVQTFNPVVDLVATKAAALAVDTAPLGGSPGDTIEYTIAIANRGTGPATNVIFSDNIPANSTYVPGSTTLNGVAVPDAGGTTMPFVGGGAISSPGALSGQIAPGGVATIRFRVLVVNPLPGGVTQIVNQGVVTSNEVPALLTDDPSTGQGGDPTITPVTAAPVISADKAAALQVDADANGVVSPGDTLRYTITIANSGNTAATGVVYTDTPDSNTTLLPNTVTTTQGTITSGNAGVPPVTVDIGAIPAPIGKVMITYDVRIKNPLPSGATEAVNQGLVTSNEVPPVPTNDPKTLPPGDSTRVPIVANPVLVAEKTAVLLIDADQNGGASPGDTLLYQISIANNGNAPATGVVYNDIPDSNTTLVPKSVQTSAGSVTSGSSGTPPVTVNIGTIPGGGVNVTITYKTTINNPLTNLNAKEIVNQGLATSNELPPLPTDDPKTPQPGDPTRVTIVLEPRVSASKVATLFADADQNGRVSPGDTLLYEVTIQNSGNAAATNAVFSDIPDVNTRLVIGSVQTSVGSVTQGNAAGDVSVKVAIGSIPARGGSVVISYRVTINNPLSDPNVSEIVNQGLVSGDFPSVPTDDPRTPQPGDPTRTPLTLEPRLIADKTASLLFDADLSGGISPGDTLQYSISIKNIGSRPATAVTFTDTPDANTVLVVGSVKTNHGTVAGGNAGVPPVTVNIGTLPNGADATITYQVTINKPLPASVTELVNQGIVRSPDSPDIPTNDPKTPPPGDPTRIRVVPAPILTADKIDFLFIDTNKSGKPGAGDTLLYVIEIANRGNVAATNVTFTDAPDSLTILVTGSVKTSQGRVTKGNTAGDADLAVDIGTIPAGGSVRVSFQARLKDVLTRNIIINQGSASGANIPAVPTNDPDTALPDDPTQTLIPPGELTSVALISFSAMRQDSGIMVRWATSAEFNTWGFYLYRSADGDRSHAVRVTPDLIPGQGRGANGMSQYSWLDNTVLSDTIYTYWLQEIELNGTTNEYGPTRVVITPAANHVIYLSLVNR